MEVDSVIIYTSKDNPNMSVDITFDKVFDLAFENMVELFGEMEISDIQSVPQIYEEFEEMLVLDLHINITSSTEAYRF